LLLDLDARQIVQTELGTITDLITLITSVCQLVRADTKEEARQAVQKSDTNAVAAK